MMRNYEPINTIFLTVVFTLPLTITSSSKAKTCVLKEKRGNYQIYCNYDGNIKIKCHEQLIENLPAMKVNVRIVPDMEFQNCSFSQTARVQNTLYSIGVKDFRAIAFYKFCNSPNRLNFENLATPHVILMNSAVNELPYDLFYGVLNLRKVTIEGTKITRIPKYFFNNWAEKVTEVFLGYNKLQKISRDDFSRLINLAKLNLLQNDIDEIESGAFDNLTQLTMLELGSNRFQTLPSGIFNHLTHLSTVNLISRTGHQYLRPEKRIMFQMTSLPPDLFKSIYKLSVIQIVGHSIQSFPLELFDSNEYLKILDISNNGLQFLPAGIFKSLKRLIAIWMDRNRLTSTLPELFIGLHSIKYLSVSENNLTQIDVQIFKYLISTVEIDFSHNQITDFQYHNQRISQYAFARLNVPENAFQRLELLNLSSNYLTDFDVIPFLTQGYFNVISKKNLDVDPLETEFVAELKHSKTVDLSNNYISKVNLTYLSSAMTKLNRFNNSNMETIKIRYATVYLDNNFLHCDCDLMDFIRYLNGSSRQDLQKYWVILAKEGSNFGEELTCSSPRELKNRDVRKVLLVEFYCPIQTNAFGSTCIETCVCQQYPEKNFLSIDCSLRNLTRLPEIQNNVHNLSIALNMSGNALISIPPLTNSYLANITDLDLSSNNISAVSLDAFSPNLRVLKLHNNSISRLDSNIIQYLARDNPLQSLTIHDNKWTCDCETHKILQSSIRKKLSNYNFHELLCYGTNRKLYEVTVEELCEETIILIVTVSLSIAFFGFIFGSLAALYYKYQKQIKIWLYSKQLCLWFVTEDELDKDKNYDAFISFSHKDEDFVETEIVAKLEAGPQPYKLCLHYRDWLAGEWIPLQISRSVANSRRTIIILTPNFLESVWGLMEFRAAHTQALEEGRACLIVILYGELGNLDDLDQELKDYLSLNTYIKWGDPWFWHKLKYALPHRSSGSRVIDKDTTVHYRVNGNSTIGPAVQSHFSSIAPCPNY